jgi:hypothetical protein
MLHLQIPGLLYSTSGMSMLALCHVLRVHLLATSMKRVPSAMFVSKRALVRVTFVGYESLVSE